MLLELVQGKRDNCRIKGGGRGYFFISKVFVNFGGLGGCSPRKFLIFQPLRLFLVASETWLSLGPLP
jgi:hypothetical protein